ncbi:hypothetical protein EI94DRAFT_1709904 [Lactarius quietus]|nr:hypothetical protein EI94DRAFT_1709904 [Lactarius quietus]
MSQRPRSLCIQARTAKESNTPTGPPEALMHSEEGSAFNVMQHIPSPISGALPTTGQVDASVVQSSGPLSAITVSSSGVPSVSMSGPPSVPMTGPLSNAPSTSGSQKRPAPYDFMDQIPASQRIAHNLPLQHITFQTQLLPRADIDEHSDDTTADNSVPDSEEDLIQVQGVPTSTIEADSAGPSVRFALPEGSPTEDGPSQMFGSCLILRLWCRDVWGTLVAVSLTFLLCHRVSHLPSNTVSVCLVYIVILGTPAFNAALDAEAEVLHRLLIDMKQMKKELHRLNERLMRDYLILETLIMNIHKRPDDLEEPDI